MTNKKSIEIDFNGISLNGKRFKDWNPRMQEAFIEGFKSNTLSSNNYKGVYGANIGSSSTNKSSSKDFDDKNGHWVTVNHKHIFIEDEKGSKKGSSKLSDKVKTKKNKNNNSVNSKHLKNTSGNKSKKIKGKPTCLTVNLNDKNSRKQTNNSSDYSRKKWPMSCAGPIKSGFGKRVAPVPGASENHNGWDIGVPVGTPVKAIADGKVIAAGPARGYGKWVVIDHGEINGVRVTSEYGHISSWEVHVGQEIKQGDIIAKSGNEGVSTGPHLHFTIKENGIPKDPLNYIKGF